MFYDKGFDVVDRQLVQGLRGQQDYTAALDGDVTAAAGASQLGAEVIVIGTAKISSGGKFYNMFSGQAVANAKIVRTDTGEILAVVPAARGKSHIFLNLQLERLQRTKLLKKWEIVLYHN